MKITIKNIEDLAKVINDKKLSRKQIDLLITKSLNVFMSSDIPTNEIIPRLEQFIKQYPETHTRPLFID
jgi:hypothetical protein